MMTIKVEDNRVGGIATEPTLPTNPRGRMRQRLAGFPRTHLIQIKSYS